MVVLVTEVITPIVSLNPSVSFRIELLLVASSTLRIEWRRTCKMMPTTMLLDTCRLSSGAVSGAN